MQFDLEETATAAALTRIANRIEEYTDDLHEEKFDRGARVRPLRLSVEDIVQAVYDVSHKVELGAGHVADAISSLPMPDSPDGREPEDSQLFREALVAAIPWALSHINNFDSAADAAKAGANDAADLAWAVLEKYREFQKNPKKRKIKKPKKVVNAPSSV